MKSCSTSKIRRCRPLLGTFVEITAEGESAEAVNAAVEEAFAAVERVQGLMSFHEQTSDVTRLNREAGRRVVRVHPWTYEVLDAAQQLHAASQGAFDITIAPHLQRWGYLPDYVGAVSIAADQSAIALLPGNGVWFHRPVQIDLGGIAKGFAVDKAIEAMQMAGVTGGLVNAGGDLRVFGPEASTVHVRRPDAPGRMLPLVKLSNAAVATSANYFARKQVHGCRVTPLVNPQTGRSCNSTRSVSVQAPTCLWADALTKVVMLQGEKSASVLRHLGVSAWIINPAGKILCTSQSDES